MHRSDVYLGQEKVGEASVRQEGLYYHFSCRCRLPSKSVYCAMLRCGESEFDLGVCVPEGNSFRADKRIPVKLFSQSEFKFYIVERNKHLHTVVPVDAQKPFSYLQHLENAYFSSENGTHQVCISEIKNSPLSQQDSDQTP